MTPDMPVKCVLLTTGLGQDTGNKVARKAILVGTQHIMLGGKTIIQADAMIRGDLARTAQPSSTPGAAAPGSNTAVAIGRYCFLSKGCCLRPPGRIYKGCVDCTSLPPSCFRLSNLFSLSPQVIYLPPPPTRRPRLHRRGNRRPSRYHRKPRPHRPERRHRRVRHHQRLCPRP